MPQTIKIAELAIDNKTLLKELSDTKKKIDELSETQKKLKKNGDTASETFIKNQADLKSLKSEFSSQIKILQTTTQATEKLTTGINKEIKSLDQAKANNKELVQLRNQLNQNTVEGAQALQEINQKLDQNNEFIKENASQLEQQKIAIGDYKNGIKDAFQEMNIFNGGLDGFIGRSKEAGGVGNLLTTSLKGMAKGFVGLTKASLAFIATPIGAVITALVAVFALVKSAMNRSEDATNKIKKAFSAFGGIAKKLLSLLQPVGEFLIDGLVKGFELVEKGIYKAIEGITSGLELLGFDDQAASLRGFNKEIQEGAKNSKELAKAEAELTKAQREVNLTQLEYQKQAEKLRQQRDNENLTIAQRTKANEELGKVLQEQLATEKKIANQALAVSDLRIKADGETSATLDARAEALTNIADIEERITGQQSEQLTNQVALQKEAKDKAKEFAEKKKEILDKAIEKQKQELALFIAQQGTRARTLQEQLDLEEAISKQSIEILDAELAAKNISQIQYDTELENIKNERLRRQSEIAIENADIELQAYIDANQSKLDSDIYFSDEALRIEQERLEGIAEKRREFAELQLEEGIINATEYNEAINEINEENRIALEEAQIERDEARKEKEAEDFQLQLELDRSRLDLDLAQNLKFLNKAKQNELKNAEKTGADTVLIQKKYAEQEKQIRQIVRDNKVNLANDAFGALADIFGRESKVGKAAAIAQTTITTYQSATSAFNSLSGIPIVGPILGAVAAAAAVAAGIANVKKITSTKEPSVPSKKTYARGGILNGASHAQGGIPTRFGELEGGEAVINRRSTAMFAPLLSSINEIGGGRRFADGGTLGVVNSAPRNLIDYDALGSKISESNRQLPAPVVSVEEINRISGNVVSIEESATF